MGGTNREAREDRQDRERINDRLSSRYRQTIDHLARLAATVVRQYQSVIAADVKADTRKLYPTEQFTAGVDQGDSSVKSFVNRRRAFLLKTVR